MKARQDKQKTLTYGILKSNIIILNVFRINVEVKKIFRLNKVKFQLYNIVRYTENIIMTS